MSIKDFFFWLDEKNRFYIMLNQKTGLEGQGCEQNWPGTACSTSGYVFQLCVSHIPHLPNTLCTYLQNIEKSLRKCIVCHSAEYAYH